MSPLQTLLTAYAPTSVRAWHRLCWLFDQRLADVVRRKGDPTIAAIRLAWWDAALVEGDRAKGGGEPLVEAWRASAPDDAAAAAEQLIDGWRMLLGDEPLSGEELADYGAKRGGGLFALLAGSKGDRLARPGAAWALWDLAGHSADADLAAAALSGARDLIAEPVELPRDRGLKPLRLVHDLAQRDIAAGRIPTRGFEGRHYRRLLWRTLID